MSRFDQPTTEPDYDRYEPKPIEDVDVPDFDQPDPPVTCDQFNRILDVQAEYNKRQSAALQTVDVINPAEHAAHALIEALTTLEQQIVLTTDLQRAWFLKGLMKRAWQHVDLVNGKALAQIDAILERRR